MDKHNENQPPIIESGNLTIGRLTSNVTGTSKVEAALTPVGPRLTTDLAVRIHDDIAAAILSRFQGASQETCEKLAALDSDVMRVLNEYASRK
jgi:hypothetical protein